MNSPDLERLLDEEERRTEMRVADETLSATRGHRRVVLRVPHLWIDRVLLAVVGTRAMHGDRVLMVHERSAHQVHWAVSLRREWRIELVPLGLIGWHAARALRDDAVRSITRHQLMRHTDADLDGLMERTDRVVTVGALPRGALERLLPYTTRLHGVSLLVVDPTPVVNAARIRFDHALVNGAQPRDGEAS